MDEEVQLVRQKGRPLEEGRLTGRVTDIDRSEKGRKCRFNLYCIIVNVAFDLAPLFAP